MEDIFFIDEKGNKLSSENINSHIGLANIIIAKKDLKEEFKESRKYSPTEFLIENKGYMAGSNINEVYRNITYDSEFTSNEQKRLIQYYAEEGYHFTDFAIEKRKIERGEI